MAVEKWVKDLTEQVLGTSPFEVGDIVTHPDGRTLKIVGGQFWGEYGISNFWYWREVLEDGTLGPEKCGYGWRLGDTTDGKKMEDTSRGDHGNT